MNANVTNSVECLSFDFEYDCLYVLYPGVVISLSIKVRR